MSTVKEARETVEKLAGDTMSEADVQAGINWLEGVGAHCKEAGLDPDRVLDAIDPEILKEATHGYDKKKHGSKYKRMMGKLKKKSQATREELAAGAAKNAKKPTPKSPQLDRGAAQAAKALKS